MSDGMVHRQLFDSAKERAAKLERERDAAIQRAEVAEQLAEKCKEAMQFLHGEISDIDLVMNGLRMILMKDVSLLEVNAQIRRAEAAEREAERYKTALQFYGDEANWKDQPARYTTDYGSGWEYDIWPSDVWNDRGEIARAALDGSGEQRASHES